MSVWSYVNGVIAVDTYSRSDAEAMYMAQTVVNHLPKIHGSEGCAKYYLNRKYGNNSSSNVDEFDNFSNLMEGENYFNSFEHQTVVLITLHGALRNAEFEEALRDTTKMLSRLSSRLRVNHCVISVSSYDRSFVFSDPEWVLNMEKTDWARDLLWQFEREDG